MLTVAEVQQLVAALAPLAGGQIQKIREPDPHTVVMRVRVPGANHFLVLSARRGVERVGLAAEAGPTLPEPTTLGRWLRSVAGGRRLEAIEALPGDRVVVLHFAEGRLVAELTGVTANLLGVDASGRVVATARPPADSERDLRSGQPWTPPAPPTGGAPRPPRHADPAAVEAEARRRLLTREDDERARALAQLAGRVRRRLARLHRNVSRDLERAEGAERFQRYGELLKAELHRVQKGDTAVRVTDWYAGTDPLPEVEVPLKPELDPAENVRRWFDKYRRARAGQEKALERLLEVEAQQARLEALAAEHDEPEALEAALREARLLRRAQQGRGGRRERTTRKPYRAWRSRTGERVLVGRGGADNHALTFQVARGNDHWLHVRDAPGAHVVVPQPTRGQEPKQETLLDAAALAAHHSDLRGEPVVDVTHARRKHVRAVRGGGPGRVTLADARTLTVADVAARLEGLIQEE